MTPPEDGRGYELVMPFVVCQTEGGPYQDDAFVAGWEMGALDARLEFERPARLEATIRTASLPQVDLVAMRRGYTLTARGQGEWASITLHRTTDRPPS